ncbi:hypothetical protein ACET3Z_013677 [Daucus carota]
MYNVEGSMESLLAATNFMFPSPAADHFAKNKETVHSETCNFMNNHDSPQPQSLNLSRYQSVPSSFLEGLMTDSVVAADYRSSNLETEIMNMNQVKKETSNGCRSSLVRQSSSPAGFWSSLADDDIGSGFTGMNDVGSFRSRNKTKAGLSSSTNRLGDHMNFSSVPSAHSRFMPQSAANVNENFGTSELYSANGHSGRNSNIPNFYNDPNCNNLKRNRDGEAKLLSSVAGLNKQNDDFNHYTSGLVHQLSLPSTSAEMATMENFLHFQQDSIPCKIRAKRGFATHPRSIAERVRRTRISARMKKLQDLFPNMDKQANTADMLDLAVVYIKDLQKEVQTLNNTRSNCTCPTRRK